MTPGDSTHDGATGPFQPQQDDVGTQSPLPLPGRNSLPQALCSSEYANTQREAPSNTRDVHVVGVGPRGLVALGDKEADHDGLTEARQASIEVSKSDGDLGWRRDVGTAGTGGDRERRLHIFKRISWTLTRRMILHVRPTCMSPLFRPTSGHFSSPGPVTWRTSEDV